MFGGICIGWGLALGAIANRVTESRTELFLGTLSVVLGVVGSVTVVLVAIQLPWGLIL